MTRESRARWLALITAAVVVLLAALFSVLRNLPAPAQPAAAAASAPEAAVRPDAESIASAPAATSASATPAEPGRAPAIAPPAPIPVPPPVAPAPTPAAPAEPRAAQPQAVRESPPSSEPSRTPAAPMRGTDDSSPVDAKPLPPAPATPSASAGAPAAPAAPPSAPSPATSARAAGPVTADDPERIATGERAYARLGCATCHSIAGRGRPSSPLDGVGGRLDRRELLEYTTGTGAARDALGAGLARRKARAVDDPDLDALIEYLAQLK